MRMRRQMNEVQGKGIDCDKLGLRLVVSRLPFIELETNVDIWILKIKKRTQRQKSSLLSSSHKATLQTYDSFSQAVP